MVKKMNIVTSVWLDEVCGGYTIGTLYMEGEKTFYKWRTFQEFGFGLIVMDVARGKFFYNDRTLHSAQTQ